MLLLFDRFVQGILRNYRKRVFQKKINCPHRNFKLVGKVNLINTNITLGQNVTIYPDVMFFGDGPIVIGDNAFIGNGTILGTLSDKGITIGKNSMIAAQCYIIDCDHGMEKGIPMMEQVQSTSPIVIGDDVWLAANVTVLKGSCICDGAVLGAKSLVKGEIPKNAVAVGIPARVIKYRENV